MQILNEVPSISDSSCELLFENIERKKEKLRLKDEAEAAEKRTKEKAENERCQAETTLKYQMRYFNIKSKLVAYYAGLDKRIVDELNSVDLAILVRNVGLLKKIKRWAVFFKVLQAIHAMLLPAWLLYILVSPQWPYGIIVGATIIGIPFWLITVLVILDSDTLEFLRCRKYLIENGVLPEEKGVPNE